MAIQGSDSVTTSRTSAFSLLVGVLLLSACSSSGSGDGESFLKTALNGPASAEREEPQVVQGTCPPVGLREGTAFYRTYSGGDGDAANIVHQASIADVTRQCTLSGGELVVNVVAGGRLITGPKGSPGAVEMPIRVVAMRGDQVLYSELTNYSTTMDSSSDQFLFDAPDVRLPADTAEDVRMFVGFDEGPYDTP